ncbi:hypothetical protein [Mycolicibacterium llatzerense]|uniref:hypothetical protein n=1 Tax=Mycolicibacterium llatzerense TaxID=280871 RepID=UPI0008DD661C|nr:hypothetical protein [Mycolicibacterium llatzerense]
MINAKVVVLGFPIYVIWAVFLEMVFGSGNPTTGTRVPIGMAIASCLIGFALAGVVLWYTLRRAARNKPDLQRDFYWVLLVALFAAGLFESAGKGLATVLLGGCPWRVLAPIFAVSYAVLWAVGAVMLTRRAKSTPTAR